MTIHTQTYHTGSSTAENRTRLEAAGYLFTEDIVDYTKSGSVSTLDKGKIDDLNDVSIRTELNTHVHGREYHHRVAEIGLKVGLEYAQINTILRRLLDSEFYEEYRIDMSSDPEMISTLLVTAENVKKQLTSKDSINVPIRYGGIQGSIEITEEIFESISQFLLGTTKDVTERLLDSVNKTWADVNGVILVGGSTRMRMIHRYVKEMSGKEPLSGVNVDEAVALGAAIWANVLPAMENVPVLGGVRRQKRSDTVSIPGANSVTDVTAHSLGMISISADGEKYVNSTIIRKNSKIPASNTVPFKFKTKAKDNELEVYVLQGEFSRPLDNTIINKYVIYDIDRTTPALSVIEVTYEYTSNGVVAVSAVQKETGKKLPIRIEPVPEDMAWTDGSPEDYQAETSGTASVDVLLAIDLSGSMSGRPLKEAKKAMKKFVDEMDSNMVKIGLMPFANRAVCELKPTNKYRKVKSAIDKLEISEEYGYGNSAHPFNLALEEFHKSDAEVKYIIVLTDGVWNFPMTAFEAAQDCHKNDIEVMALGFGQADYNFLKMIASVDEFASFHL